MGLKATLFKKAEADSRQFYPAMPVPYEKQTAEAVISCAAKCGFSVIFWLIITNSKIRKSRIIFKSVTALPRFLLP